MDVNKLRYISTDKGTIHREKGFYQCQACKQPVFLKLCLDRVSHFAHFADNKECDGEWEQDTEMHSIMKQDVYNYFKKFSWVQKIELEYPVDIKGKIYIPDIYIETINNHKIVIECQAHKITRDVFLKRALTYANEGIYPLFILEAGEFIGEFIVPRDDLYVSPKFEEKSDKEDAFVQRFYIYDLNRGSLDYQKGTPGDDNVIDLSKDAIYSIDVVFARIPLGVPVGTHVESYETKVDFSSYKINFSKVKYNSNDELIVSEIPMVVDMNMPRFNFGKIAKLRQEEELRERLRQQVLNDKSKEYELKRVEEELRTKEEDERQRRMEGEIRKRKELQLQVLKEKCDAINVDEPWSLYANIPGLTTPMLLPPLSWKGGDQASNLKEMLIFFKKFYIPDNTKIMIYKSVCGSGKSGSILHVIRGLGRGIIVTPFKALQRQYYDDYFKGNKFVMKKDGKRLNVAVLLGRSNFPCKWLAEEYDYQQTLIAESKKPENAGVYFDIDENILSLYRYDKSAANRRLPCTKSLRIVGKGAREPRWTVATACPYWVPTPMSKVTIDKWQEKSMDKEEDVEKLYEDANEGENIPDIENSAPMVMKSKTRLDSIKERLQCSDIKYYESVGWGQVGVFIRDEVNKDGEHCPEVCPYYRQFYSYVDADVIVMNSAKWQLETRIGRKPLTDVEVFDEGDYWLDGQASDIELSRSTIDRIVSIDNKVKRMKDDTVSMFDQVFRDVKFKSDQQRKISENKVSIIDAKEYTELFTNVTNTLGELLKGLEDDEKIEEKIVDMVTALKYIEKASISYREGKREETKVLKVYIPYPDEILRELFKLSSSNIIITSGTMQTSHVMSNLFGINADNYTVDVLNGRKESPGKLKCIRYKESDMPPVKVTYQTWQSPQFVDYYNRYTNGILDRLKDIIDKVTGKPGEAKIIVLTPAKKYAEGIKNRPDTYIDFANVSKEEDDTPVKINTTLGDYVSKTLEDVRKIKETDINLDGDVLRTDKQIIVSTRMVRGSDLRDDKCRAVVVLKWPYPDISAGYNQALKKRFGDSVFGKIMSDKAEREVVQMVSRGLRHDLDWAYFSTPDDMAWNNVFRLFSYDK